MQDAYSLRCSPQVTGAVRDTIAHARRLPPANWRRPSTTQSCCLRARSPNGNFHGAPVAYVLDFLAIAVADLGSIAERRTDRMLDLPGPATCRLSWLMTRAWTRA
nr:aromatic amino acid lyase [Glutamicibacter nicotianae]